MSPDPLDALLADAVAAEASIARAKERVLRQAAEEGATVVGSLVELAERQAAVTTRTAAGRSHRGHVVAVGRDFVVMRDGMRPAVFVAIAAIAWVRPVDPIAHDTTGDRAAPVEASLAAVLTGLAGDRPRVQLSLMADTQPLTGQLRAVGLDIVTIHLEDGARSPVYVPVASISEVALLDG